MEAGPFAQVVALLEAYRDVTIVYCSLTIPYTL